MNEWTVFYWSWWIAWSPFVGAFIAKISRGRTIREFIHGSLTAPVLFSFFWITVFGGSGIKMERVAAQHGLCCPNWTFDTETAGSKTVMDSVLGNNRKLCNLCRSILSPLPRYFRRHLMFLKKIFVRLREISVYFIRPAVRFSQV